MSTPIAPGANASIAQTTGSGLNDASVSGSYTQITAGTFTVTLSSVASPNQFSWTESGGSGSSASNVAITGSAQLLADGISITFAALTGHTISNVWTIVSRPRARTFWDSSGIEKIIWSDGSIVTMSGAGGSTNFASPGTIGATTPGIVHMTSLIGHGATSGTITFNPAAISGAQTYTLPTGYPGGNGYQLASTTLGVLSWAAAATPFDPTAPGPIGGTTPAAITGTVITANSWMTSLGYICANNAAGKIMMRGWTADANYGAIYMGRIATPGDANWSIVATDSGGDLGPLFFNGLDLTWRLSNSTKMTLDTNGFNLVTPLNIADMPLNTAQTTKPTIATAGTSATVTNGSTDEAGTISIVGTAFTGNTTVTYSLVHASAAKSVVITDANGTAAGLSVVPYWNQSASDNTKFVVVVTGLTGTGVLGYKASF